VAFGVTAAFGVLVTWSSGRARRSSRAYTPTASDRHGVPALRSAA
jgi:hypothetical protein